MYSVGAATPVVRICDYVATEVRYEYKISRPNRLPCYSHIAVEI